MLGTCCEAGFVQPLKDTKENKMYSLLSSEKCKQTHPRQHVRTLFRISTAQQTPEDLRSVRHDLTGRTVLKCISAFISPDSPTLQYFLLESHSQPLQMHGDTPLCLCSMHVKCIPPFVNVYLVCKLVSVILCYVP